MEGPELATGVMELAPRKSYISRAMEWRRWPPLTRAIFPEWWRVRSWPPLPRLSCVLSVGICYRMQWSCPAAGVYCLVSSCLVKPFVAFASHKIFEQLPAKFFLPYTCPVQFWPFDRSGVCRSCAIKKLVMSRKKCWLQVKLCTSAGCRWSNVLLLAAAEIMYYCWLAVLPSRSALSDLVWQWIFFFNAPKVVLFLPEKSNFSPKKSWKSDFQHFSLPHKEKNYFKISISKFLF